MEVVCGAGVYFYIHTYNIAWHRGFCVWFERLRCTSLTKICDCSLLLLLHRLGRGVCGRVKFSNLADGFVERPLEQFSVGDVVKAKVLE